MTDAYVFQLLGLAYFAAGLGMLIRPAFYARMIAQMLESPPVIYVSGFMTLTLGYLLIRFYGTTSADLRLILTIIGWIALLKGLNAIILPDLLIKFSRGFLRSGRTVAVAGTVMTAVGIAMMYVGFIVLP